MASVTDTPQHLPSGVEGWVAVLKPTGFLQHLLPLYLHMDWVSPECFLTPH